MGGVSPGTPASAYSRHPRALWRRVGQEVVALGPSDGEVRLLSPTAAAVWDAVSDPVTLEELSAALAARFDADRSVIERDVEHLLADLARWDLVVELGR